MTTDLELDRASLLVAAGRRYRDGWVPVTGSRTSGFAVPSTEAIEALSNLDTTPATVASARRALDNARRALGLRFLDVRSPAYPPALAELDSRPALLLLRGVLPETEGPPVAIVGSRRASPSGTAAARRLASDLADAGSLIVSGLAAGIDTAAHQGAVEAHGSTVAVMGTGPTQIFPAENRALAERILERGGLLSQFPPDAGPTKTSFPARNALIAGLSSVSVLIEMSEHSGTRIEANCAIAQGKQVLLWEPLLGQHQWAQMFADHPQVHFVSASDKVIELAGRSDGREGTGRSD